MTPVDVLLAEQRPGAGKRVRAHLRAHGHQVWTCRPPPGSAAPCIGLALGRCPLDFVVVVVDVRTTAAGPTGGVSAKVRFQQVRPSGRRNREQVAFGGVGPGPTAVASVRCQADRGPEERRRA
jgi:hypothetical protein